MSSTILSYFLFDNAGEADSDSDIINCICFYRDASGEDKLNVKFEPGELREAARTFEEGN